ncbi:PEP-CTERM sorting domain-containing protein [Adhaeretor mobilis]|uniref:PEP-CTERM protein-sorting domain-containing protein n=1 Tax=Adhaeretor mobilis TaxID=1930276 RepID=A0A517MQK7_9BACT|nr:PEP-CTERM sorting domain-containing protein [Adhaeretor mobilis]QDS97166.1 hypothetical protein HG15A2_04260 [Adhaeretor mobilis]
MTFSLPSRLALLSLALLHCNAVRSHAEEFGGIEFPGGASSFADSVIQYDPAFSGGNVPTAPSFLNPADALGPPDFSPASGNSDTGAVSLGSGGLIELAFTDNVLTNSGDTDFDLHIFEIGSAVEDTFVAVRPNAATLALLVSAVDANSDGFLDLGSVNGATSSIDIDAIFSGFSPGQLVFDAVQLVDDPNKDGTTGATIGADIDAVGAIASSPIPEPASLTCALMLSFWLAGRRKLSRNSK